MIEWPLVLDQCFLWADINPKSTRTLKWEAQGPSFPHCLSPDFSLWIQYQMKNNEEESWVKYKEGSLVDKQIYGDGAYDKQLCVNYHGTRVRND